MLITVLSNRAEFMMAYMQSFSFIVSVLFAVLELETLKFFAEVYMHIGKCACLKSILG
jgi:hypothetical protein